MGAIDTAGRAAGGAYLRGPAPRPTPPHPHNSKEKIKNARRLRADYQFFFQEKGGRRNAPPTARPEPFLLLDVKPAIIQQYEENV